MDVDELDELVCEICHSPDDEDTMLICEQCEKLYHMACLLPPLGHARGGLVLPAMQTTRRRARIQAGFQTHC